MSEDALTARTPPPTTPRPVQAGDVIGNYVLTGRQLGQGGFATVYEASHRQFEMRVAIKISAAITDPGLRVRAIREADALARIQHRNVVRVFDAGERDDGSMYLAMELLSGESLSGALREGPIARARVVGIVRALANALDAVHTRGLVHRDLKPGNVFLCRDDDGEIVPKLIDFGIAKDLGATATDLTHTGAFIGTPTYMSPEQCNGDPNLGPRADIYALGVLAYHLVVGHPPFQGATFEVAHHQVHTPPPTSGELALDAVLARVLAKAPDMRPASAGEAGDLLVEALTAPRPAAGPPGVPVTTGRARRRGPIVAALGLIAVLGVGLAIARAPRHATRAPSASAAPALGGSTSADARPLASAPPDAPSPALDAMAMAMAAPPDAVVAPDARGPRKPPRKRNIDDVESLPGR